MNISIPHIIHEQHFWLSAQRSIYWEEQKTMIVSDTHFGKTGHFRKSGIAVPQQVYKEDLQRFFSLATDLKPERILVVGDFFHSTDNEEHNLFLRWKNDFNSLQITLIKGNHDILGNTWYENAGIQLIEDFYEIGQFRFQHDPAENDFLVKENTFVFSGHVHPGIQMRGIGKQSLRFPCFYFTATNAQSHCGIHFSK